MLDLDVTKKGKDLITMPLYEYKCSNPDCENEFELIQPITAPSLNECPRCGSIANRQISESTFILRGSGWYATDYGNKSKSSNKKKETGASNSTTVNSTTPSSLKTS